MFTGIVEEIGKVIEATPFTGGIRMKINAKTVLGDLNVKDSISVSGVCLTVVGKDSGSFSVDIVRETLDHSNLGQLAKSNAVNLERAMKMSARLGGHMVQGHVDAVGKITRVDKDGGNTILAVRVPDDVLPYIVLKGSICLDGISLTVAALDGDEVTVALIPHTLSTTTIGARKAGDELNVEVDVIAKYVKKMLKPFIVKKSLTYDDLIAMGY